MLPYINSTPYQSTVALGENSCICFTWARTVEKAKLQKQNRRQSIASSREGVLSYELTFTLGENSCKCFTWARTAANAPATKARYAIVLQKKGYLHQATNSHLLWARTAANASRGPEQQLQKQGRRQSIAEGIFTPSSKVLLWARTAANASCGPVRNAHLLYTVQYSMAQCSFLFLKERTGL